VEDNELPLLEGEIIEDIEPLDEGWWSGTGPGGRSGLFPGRHLSLRQFNRSFHFIYPGQQTMWKLWKRLKKRQPLHLLLPRHLLHLP